MRLHAWRSGASRWVIAVLVAAIAVTVGVAIARPEGEEKASHANLIVGSDRDDHLTGTRQRDRIDAGAGDDVLEGRSGHDFLLGRGGDDRLLSRDHRQDVVDCGPGDDVAIVSRAEIGVYDCETVKTPTLISKASR